MKRNFVIITAMLLIVALAGSLFTGCSKDSNDGNPTKSAENQTSATTATTAAAEQSAYPLKSDVTLTRWMFNSSNEANFGDSPFAKELEKRTGIKVEYLHAAKGQETTQFNIMLASGELPDIIESYWFGFPGGPEKAINDGYILKLNDIIKDYAPNLSKVLEDNPEVARDIKTDSGALYVFPAIQDDVSMTVFGGPFLRKDWLDDLGLKVPETIDEWYTVLKAFKEKKGAAAPLSIFYNYFMVPYGVWDDFYQEDGRIKYGPIEAGYKDYLMTFRKWYNEGLLDKNYAAVDVDTLNANMTSGKSGAICFNVGGGMGTFLTLMKEKDPKYDLVGAPIPVLNKGETPKFGPLGLRGLSSKDAAISAKSKNVELAAKYLDYAYSEEGKILFNFGTEGVSYALDGNGDPKYSELITKNPDGLSMGQAINQYARAASGGPFVRDLRYFQQYVSLPQQIDAVKKWVKTDMSKHILPHFSPTQDESAEVAKIMNIVNTYKKEQTTKFIMGVDPIEKFDEYVSQIKKMNIDKVIDTYQNALDRYNKR